MVMMTYQLPEQITQITSSGEFNEFDLNVFLKQKVKKISQNLYTKMKFKSGWI